MYDRPLGEPVLLPPAAPPAASTLPGRTIKLVSLAPEHADELYPLINSDDDAQVSLWDYMPIGPYDGVESFRDAVRTMSTSKDPFFYAIIDNRPNDTSSTTTTTTTAATAATAATPKGPLEDTYGKAIGYISLMSYSPENNRIEIGNVLFTHAVQKTTGATEAVYLLLRTAFDDLGYRRVEWKCNALNQGSRGAALRYGFTFEGIFRQHMVVKGRNRDTAWFSIVREEWEGGLKGAFEGWLDAGNFDAGGRQRKRLEEFQQHKKGHK